MLQLSCENGCKYIKIYLFRPQGDSKDEKFKMMLNNWFELGRLDRSTSFIEGIQGTFNKSSEKPKSGASHLEKALFLTRLLLWSKPQTFFYLEKLNK